MSFQESRVQTEQKVMVELLTEIERNPLITQRGLATELGIALGLMNQYLKRGITKGWIRASQISPKRIKYFLTPVGFQEKSQMVKGYLSRSMTFFREARSQCEEVFSECLSKQWKKIALFGKGDLADIATLVAQGTGLQVTVIEGGINIDHLEVNHFDAVIVTDIVDPQGSYNLLQRNVESHRLITLRLLHISRNV